MNGPEPNPAPNRSEAVQRALTYLESRSEISAETTVLLYGSRARGTDTLASDIDLLILGTKVDHTTSSFQETSLDVLRETPESALKQIHKTDPWNNNFLLNVLVEAIVLRDPHHLACPLIEQAHQIWKAGPPPFRPAEARKARHSLRVMLRSAKAENLHGATSEALYLTRMRLDQVVSRSVYLTYKARRRWTRSFPALVAALPHEEPEMYALWSQYIASSTHDLLQPASKIVNHTRRILRGISDR